MKQNDFYEILGVNKKTPLAEIKLKYRALAKKYHPDKNIGNKEAEDMFKLIGEAYSTLIDKEKRKRYDRLVSKYGYGAVKNGSGEEVKYQVKTPSAVANDMMGAILGASKGATKKISKVTENIKEKLNNSQKPKKGGNIESTIEITLNEGYFGVEKKISIKSQNDGLKKVTIDVPRGIKNGEKIRLAALGKPGKYGGKTGDLIITVKLKEDKTLKLDGSNIKVNIDISYAASIVGDKIQIKTFGKTLKTDVPTRTKQGDELIIKNEGYFINNTLNGDLIITFNIKQDEKLTDREIKIYEQLLKVEKQKQKEKQNKKAT